jgi:hypothetical protein
MEESITNQQAVPARRPTDPLEGLPMLIPVPRGGPAARHQPFGGVPVRRVR